MKKFFLISGVALLAVGMIPEGRILAEEKITTDVFLDSGGFFVTPAHPVEKQGMRIYAAAGAGEGIDVYGSITFYVEGKQVGSTQPISIVNGRSDAVFIDFVPEFGGYIDVKAIVAAAVDDTNLANNSATIFDFFVDYDSDGDDVPNRDDIDDDNDGLNDNDEAGHGTNLIDYDSDNDGLSDGREINRETDPLNADSDGDGLSDGDEVNRGTDPLNAPGEEVVLSGEDDNGLNQPGGSVSAPVRKATQSQSGGEEKSADSSADAIGKLSQAAGGEKERVNSAGGNSKSLVSTQAQAGNLEQGSTPLPLGTTSAGSTSFPPPNAAVPETAGNPASTNVSNAPNDATSSRPAGNSPAASSNPFPEEAERFGPDLNNNQLPDFLDEELGINSSQYALFPVRNFFDKLDPAVLGFRTENKNSEDAPPILKLDVQQTGFLKMRFDARASTDDRGIVAYALVLSEKQRIESTEPIISKRFTRPGDFEIIFLIKDSADQTALEKRIIHVSFWTWYIYLLILVLPVCYFYRKEIKKFFENWYKRIFPENIFSKGVNKLSGGFKKIIRQLEKWIKLP